MARMRLVLVFLSALVMAGCPLLEQPTNFVSFTLNGIHYLYTASAVRSDHAYAVGFASPGFDPWSYDMWASATPADGEAYTNTLNIHIGSDGDWYLSIDYYDSNGYAASFYPDPVPEGMIDSFIANRDAVGEQFAGSIPGPFVSGQSIIIEDILFSVERLPNEEPQAQ